MSVDTSITRRVTVSVLLLELLAAIALIAMVTNHERVVRFQALDANLRAMSNALLGAVQEAEAENGSVKLDARVINVSPKAIYRVSADAGQVLGAQGNLPSLSLTPRDITKVRIGGSGYRFYMLQGERVIDPDSPHAVNHQVTVVYGIPEGHTWHEVFEATEFFACATVVLLGITALIMSWFTRRLLAPIRELADEAGQIDAERWIFNPPDSSQRFAELAPLAAAIQKTVTRLHASFEQQRRFTSDAAHELKTDLAIIKSSVQLLGMRQRTVDEYHRGLTLSMSDIARLEGTVQKMLTLARVEHSAFSKDNVCDLSGVLKRVLKESRPVATLKQIEVGGLSVQASVFVPLSEEEATLLCSNILMNALQHSPPGSSVEVDLRSDVTAAILSFRDHGPGILPGDLPFLFDAFYRGDPSRSRASGGTGLGLSICKAICDRAQGHIQIDNHPEGGAEVKVVLPRQ